MAATPVPATVSHSRNPTSLLNLVRITFELLKIFVFFLMKTRKGYACSWLGVSWTNVWTWQKMNREDEIVWEAIREEWRARVSPP